MRKQLDFLKTKSIRSLYKIMQDSARRAKSDARFEVRYQVARKLLLEKSFDAELRRLHCDSAYGPSPLAALIAHHGVRAGGQGGPKLPYLPPATYFSKDSRFGLVVARYVRMHAPRRYILLLMQAWARTQGISVPMLAVAKDSVNAPWPRGVRALALQKLPPKLIKKPSQASLYQAYY